MTTAIIKTSALTSILSPQLTFLFFPKKSKQHTEQTNNHGIQPSKTMCGLCARGTRSSVMLGKGPKRASSPGLPWGQWHQRTRAGSTVQGGGPMVSTLHPRTDSSITAPYGAKKIRSGQHRPIISAFHTCNHYFLLPLKTAFSQPAT